jgi:hypothetical protein
MERGGPPRSPAYKRLSIVLDEQAPTYAPPAPVRIVQPELAAVDEQEQSLFGVITLSGAGEPLSRRSPFQGAASRQLVCTSSVAALGSELRLRVGGARVVGFVAEQELAQAA